MSIIEIIAIVSMVVAGASVLAKAVTMLPFMQDTEVDNKVYDALIWFKEKILDKIALNS